MVQLWKHGENMANLQSEKSLPPLRLIKQHGEPTMLKNMTPILPNAAPPMSAKRHFVSDKYATKNLKLVFQIKGNMWRASEMW